MKTQTTSIRIALGMGVVIGMAGCASIPTETVPRYNVAAGTTNYNLALEQAQNEMLLLNIVRASKQNPMYFTALTDMKGSLSYGVNGTLTFPFGPVKEGVTGSNMFSTTASLAANPVFTVSPLNSKEFLLGMLSPVPLETFAQFWEEGWHHDLLFYLFFQNIQKKVEGNGNGNGKLLPNHPFLQTATPLHETFADFKAEVRKLLMNFDCELNRPKEEERKIGPAMKATDVAKSDLDALTKMDKGELRLKEVTEDGTEVSDENRKEITKKNKTIVWQLYAVKKNEYILNCKPGMGKTDDDGKKLEPRSYELVTTALDKYTPEPENKQKSNAEPDNKVVGKILLRSPESILYYLGEVMRYQAEKHGAQNITLESKICQNEKAVFLFLARKETAATEKSKFSNPHLSVDYDGGNYIIPRLADREDPECPPDESMHILSLLSLLISKEQSVAGLPPPVGVSTTIGK